MTAKRAAVITVAVLATICMATRALAVGLAEDIGAMVRDAQHREGLPGISVAVVVEDETVYAAGHGVESVEYGIAATKDTVYSLASASKFISSLLFLSFIQSEQLDLSKTLGEYISGLPEDRKRIPIWSVLNHTSGLPEPLLINEFTRLSDQEKAGFSPKEIVAFINKYPVDFPQGKDWRYQQSGYATIVSILEAWEKESFVDMVSSRILKPFGMKTAVYGDSSVVLKGRNPVQYYKKKKVLSADMSHYPPAYYSGAGLNASVMDMAALFKGLNQGKIITTETLRLGYADRYLVKVGDEFYGLSMTVRKVSGSIAIGHSGGNGFTNILYFPTEKIGIAIFSNLSQSNVGRTLGEKIANRIMK